jgi:hypothetical protein
MKTPNPKYAITDRPEIPFCGMNIREYYLGRTYHIARSGNESSRPYIEYKGRRLYVTEQWLYGLIAEKYTSEIEKHKQKNIVEHADTSGKGSGVPKDSSAVPGRAEQGKNTSTGRGL